MEVMASSNCNEMSSRPLSGGTRGVSTIRSSVVCTDVTDVCNIRRLAGCPHFIIGQIYLSRIGPIVGTFKSVPIIEVSTT